MQIPSWPSYSSAELEAVSAILKSGRVNYWTGNHGKAFERDFAKYCGADYGVAMANGSVALGAALRAVGVGPGNEVVVTPRSFFASASEIALLGATPVFADVDRDSQNISAATIEAVLTPATRAVVCVHLAGWPCAMPDIMALAESKKLAVIEDCAQAHGAKISGRAVGGWGDAAAFSFCQDKIMSTGGEGGMFLTSDIDIYHAVWSYKDHGKSYKAVYERDHPPGFRWLHESFGTNLRMTEMQAAIGAYQLNQLDGWVQRRRANAAILGEALAELGVVRVPRPEDNIQHSYYKYYVFVEPERLRSGWSRDRIIAEFSRAGIPGLSGSCPEIYREKAFASMTSAVLPVARELGETSIMFEVHPTLEDKHIGFVADTAKTILRRAQA